MHPPPTTISPASVIQTPTCVVHFCLGASFTSFRTSNRSSSRERPLPNSPFERAQRNARAMES